MRHAVAMKAKMALVGDSGVGKTSLIRRFVLNEFKDEYINTLGTRVSKIELEIPHGDEFNVRMVLSIFDIVGQPGFGDLVKETFFHNCQGIIAVCDLTRNQTLNSLERWIGTATEVAGDVPVIILANKKDLASQATISKDDVEKVAKIRECAFAFTSAKTGEFVDDAFNSLAVEIVESAFKAYEASRADKQLREGLLAYLVKRGGYGSSRSEIFRTFKGVGYSEMKREIEDLESEGLLKIDWRGPEDFSVFATRAAEKAVRAWQESPHAL